MIVLMLSRTGCTAPRRKSLFATWMRVAKFGALMMKSCLTCGSARAGSQSSEKGPEESVALAFGMMR
jgi:hypothetical protein